MEDSSTAQDTAQDMVSFDWQLEVLKQITLTHIHLAPEHIMVGKMKKAALLMIIFLLSLTLLSVQVNAQYFRFPAIQQNQPTQEYGDQYSQYGYGDQYKTELQVSESFQGFYDPVIFGPLGNAYYAGWFVGTGFPFYANEPTYYQAYGPYYRYSSPYGGYGFGYYGFGSYGYNGYGHYLGNGVWY